MTPFFVEQILGQFVGQILGRISGRIESKCEINKWGPNPFDGSHKKMGARKPPSLWYLNFTPPPPPSILCSMYAISMY
jgi:hypothetical protein